MRFYIDKQTLDDLAIFGKRGHDSIYTVFNRAHTRGGSEMLEHMFRYPLADKQAIQDRSRIIQYFKEIGDKLHFPLEPALFDEAEQYLEHTDTRSQLAVEDNTLEQKFKNYLGTDNPYKALQRGLLSVIHILTTFQKYISNFATSDQDAPYKKDTEHIIALYRMHGLDALVKNEKKKLTYSETVRLDKLLRFTKREEIKKIFYEIYTLDVYISVAKVAMQHRFAFPTVLDKQLNALKLKEVYHPQLASPIANSIEMTSDNHILFLTGANMAGKSTFMKSLGIAVFLAHVGFPVPAKEMEFSVKDGMFTSINLPDNLNMGYSHFYAEVLRVKKVAEEIGQNKNLFVMFDEMFRGTNVKDAYDATVALTEAFDQKPNCTFIISTHITEAGEQLGKSCRRIHFKFLPTHMNGNHPMYTYQLETGISEDRHGMLIIKNEKILEIIKKRK